MLLSLPYIHLKTSFLPSVFISPIIGALLRSFVFGKRVIPQAIISKRKYSSIFHNATTSDLQDISKFTRERKSSSLKKFNTTILAKVGSSKDLILMAAVISTKPNVVFVLGGPGAGKGTQCSKIVEKFGFVHLSAGDLLREERNKAGSEFGELIEKHIRDGTIVPVEITCSLIDRAMSLSGSNRFLIDGFPRNQNNLDGWEKEMSAKVNVLFVLFFDASEEICVERCLSRGQAGSGRSDDNPESLKKRIFTYMNDTVPIVQRFVVLDLVRKVDASRNPEEVFQEVEILFNTALDIRDITA